MTDHLNQFFLVLLVIGSVGTEIYVMVLMCLVDWHSGNTRLLATGGFATCCMSCLRKRLYDFGTDLSSPCSYYLCGLLYR